MRALEGIKVLDLSRLIPGPYCSMILADLGADVLRIEGPQFADEGAGIPTLMRNKRHMSLNLKQPKGLEIFYRLAAGADVLLEGFRPGVARRLGIDYERLKEQNEKLVYCSITGYGQDGPCRNIVGHDINYLGFAGMLGLTAEPGGEPVIPPIQIADIAAGGMNAAMSILAALMARQKTGKGQYIDISMLDGAIALMPYLISLLWEMGEAPSRKGTRLTGRYPCYHVYQTREGQHISLGALEPRFWAALCRKLGREDYIPFQYDEGEKREEIFLFLRRTFRNKTRREWMEALKDLDVCIGEVLPLDEALSNPQVTHRKMVLDFIDEKKGRMHFLASPLRLSDTPPDIRMAPADFGEHTDEVLTDLGFSAAEIEELKEKGVV